jgi:hypothetical protein
LGSQLARGFGLSILVPISVTLATGLRLTTDLTRRRLTRRWPLYVIRKVLTRTPFRPRRFSRTTPFFSAAVLTLRELKGIARLLRTVRRVSLGTVGEAVAFDDLEAVLDLAEPIAAAGFWEVDALVREVPLWAEHAPDTRQAVSSSGTRKPRRRHARRSASILKQRISLFPRATAIRRKNGTAYCR